MARNKIALVGAGTATFAEPRCGSHGEWLAACARWRTAQRTYSATVSLAAAAAFSHRAFSPAGTLMVSVSLMSVVSHTILGCQKRSIVELTRSQAVSALPMERAERIEGSCTAYAPKGSNGRLIVCNQTIDVVATIVCRMS